MVNHISITYNCFCTKAGGVAAFIDAEHAMDSEYAKNLVLMLMHFVSQPDTGEQGLEICETLVRSGAIDIVVIDSVAALVPKAEIEGEMGDSYGVSGKAYVSGIAEINCSYK